MTCLFSLRVYQLNMVILSIAMLDNYVRLSEGKSVAKNIDILGWQW